METQYTPEELEAKLWGSYPVGNMAKHGKEYAGIEFIGTVRSGYSLYDLYQDAEKDIWYKVRIETRDGIVSEHEAIFGYPETALHKRKRM